MQGKKNQKVEEKMEDTFSLYNMLNINRDATEQEIKKQYRLLALKFHPDKNQGDSKAKEMFQKIAEAYEILSNEVKRKAYDRTGLIEDTAQYQQAYDYYRDLFPKISKEDIIDFEKRYRFGQMEQEDLIAHYEKYKGDLRDILQCVPFSKNEDIPRFIEFYADKIHDKSVKSFRLFDLSKNKIKLLKDESAEAELQQQESLQQLAQQINGRKGKFEDMLMKMEEKYVQKEQIKKKIKKTK